MAMKFSILALSVLVLSSNAFAISDEDLANQCLETGKSKLVAQEESYGCIVDVSDTKVEDIDNRWFSSSKYIWYKAEGECNGSDELVVMVQYSEGNCI
jgi:hypothetical protein